MPPAGRTDAAGVVESVARRMMYDVAKDQHTASGFDLYRGVTYAVRDRLMERWFRTQSAYYVADTKRVYYLSSCTTCLTWAPATPTPRPSAL